MKPEQIQKITDHRPWPLPESKWKFYQEWNEAVFLHWQVNYEDLRKFVPPGLEIDLFEGKPWVSVVAFTMENIRPRYLPAFPPVSCFHELNIRTYVKHGGKAGVYFLSMEGSKWLSCVVSKGVSELPYRYSKMQRKNGSFWAENSAFNDHFSVDYAPGGEVKEKKEVEKWLSERYALLQDAGEDLHKFEVHHLEWPLQEIEVSRLQLSYKRFEKLLQGEPQLQNYSPGVQVLAWGKEKNKKQALMR